MSKTVIVTRYLPLAEYLKQTGVVPEDTPVLGRVRPEDVEGCHVFGTLPLWLASFAESVTEYVLVSPTLDTGREMIKTEDVERFLRPPRTYRVERVVGGN